MNLSKIILKFIFAFLVFLITGEITLRLAQPQKTYSTLLSLIGEQYRPGDFIPFTLKPNYNAKMPSMEYPSAYVSITTNSLGFRGKEITTDKPQGLKRVLILGDSYTFGVYVDNNETYSAVLENLFSSEGKNIGVTNAGYADGWGPDEHYAWAFKPWVAI